MFRVMHALRESTPLQQYRHFDLRRLTHDNIMSIYDIIYVIFFRPVHGHNYHVPQRELDALIRKPYIGQASRSAITRLLAACANLVFLMNRHGYDDGKVRRKVYHFRHHWHTCGAERLGRWVTFYDRFRDELIRLLQRR